MRTTPKPNAAPAPHISEVSRTAGRNFRIGGLVKDSRANEASEVRSSRPCAEVEDYGTADVPRPSAHLGRWGGEEFCVILPDTDEASARAVMERILDALRHQPVDGPSGPIRVTASAGMTTREPWDTALDGLLRRADAALYQAKSEGRDRLVTWRA